MTTIFEFVYRNFEGTDVCMHVIADDKAKTFRHDCFSDDSMRIALHNVCAEIFYKSVVKADENSFPDYERYNACVKPEDTFREFDEDWFERLDFESRFRYLSYLCQIRIDVDETGKAKIVKNRYGAIES